MVSSFSRFEEMNFPENLPTEHFSLFRKRLGDFRIELPEENLFRLDQIAKLEENWNGYGARPFSQDLVDKCKDIISELELQPKIFPTGRQSIQFQYELEDRSYLEFEIFREKISYLEVPQRRYSDARTFEFPISETKRIKEIIKEFYGQDGSRERNIVPGG